MGIDGPERRGPNRRHVLFGLGAMGAAAALPNAAAAREFISNEQAAKLVALFQQNFSANGARTKEFERKNLSAEIVLNCFDDMQRLADALNEEQTRGGYPALTRFVSRKAPYGVFVRRNGTSNAVEHNGFYAVVDGNCEEINARHTILTDGYKISAGDVATRTLSPEEVEKRGIAMERLPRYCDTASYAGHVGAIHGTLNNGERYMAHSPLVKVTESLLALLFPNGVPASKTASSEEKRRELLNSYVFMLPRHLNRTSVDAIIERKGRMSGSFVGVQNPETSELEPVGPLHYTVAVSGGKETYTLCFVATEKTVLDTVRAVVVPATTVKL
ncbi:hypothetical protein EBR66_01360 [bacterium]|nr:hypothetical protein [bacterium]